LLSLQRPEMLVQENGVPRLLAAYLEHRRDVGEPFHAFAQRHSVEQLRAWCEATEAAAV